MYFTIVTGVARCELNDPTSRLVDCHWLNPAILGDRKAIESHICQLRAFQARKALAKRLATRVAKFRMAHQ